MSYSFNKLKKRDKNLIAGYGRISGSSSDTISTGSFTQGYVSYESSFGPGQSGTITSAGHGLFTQGFVGSGSAGILSLGSGSFTQGFASGYNSKIVSSGEGIFSQGLVKSGNGFALYGKGIFQQGYSSGSSLEASDLNGVLVQGSFKNNSNSIKNQGSAIFVQGDFGRDQSSVAASGSALFVQGMTEGTSGSKLQASGHGTFIQGKAVGTAVMGNGTELNGYGIFIQGFASASSNFNWEFGNNYGMEISSGTHGNFMQGAAIEDSVFISLDSGGTFSQGLAIGSGKLLHINGLGSFIQAYSSGSGAYAGSFSRGGFAQGFAKGGNQEAFVFAGAGSSEPGDTLGNFVQGYALAGMNSRAQIKSDGFGSFSQGATLKNGELASEGRGVFAQGFSSSSLDLGNGEGSATIKASGDGVLIQGSVVEAGRLETYGGSTKGILIQGYSSQTIPTGTHGRNNGILSQYSSAVFAQGVVNYGQMMAYSGTGVFLQGYAAGSDSIALIQSHAKGGFTQGFVSGNNASIVAGDINKNIGMGLFSQGFAADNSRIVANSYGSFSRGFASGSSYISAEENGAFAHGYVKNNSIITSMGIGSTAIGAAINGGSIRARGSGSFAFGYSNSASTPVEASASHSVQFLPSSQPNNIPFSFKIGDGPLIRNLKQAGIDLAGPGGASELLPGQIFVSDSLLGIIGSPLVLSGSTSYIPLRTYSTSLTSSFDYSIYLLNASSPREIELDQSMSFFNSLITIKDASFSAAVNPITITVGGGGLIDGSSSQIINTNSGSMTLIGEGGNFYII